MDLHLADESEECTTKRLKSILKLKYGSEIIITDVAGKPSVVKDISHKILHEKWSRNISNRSNKEKIMERAASIILDDIRTSIYDLTKYPDFVIGEEEDEWVPASLDHFLRCLIKSKSTNSKVTRRRCSAISHAIIAACRPRSFISPILLSLAMYVHRKYQKN